MKTIRLKKVLNFYFLQQKFSNISGMNWILSLWTSIFINSMIETFASMNNTQLLVYGLIRYNIEPIHKCDNWILRIPSLNNIREVYHGHRYTRFNPELNSFIKLDEATPDLLAVSGNKFCEMQLEDLSDCFRVFDLKICDRGLPLMEPLANSGCLAHIFAKKIKKIRCYCILKIKEIRFPFFF